MFPSNIRRVTLFTLLQDQEPEPGLAEAEAGEVGGVSTIYNIYTIYLHYIYTISTVYLLYTYYLGRWGQWSGQDEAAGADEEDGERDHQLRVEHRQREPQVRAD